MFAAEHSGVEADMMTIAKGLAGGFPLAAVVGKAAVMDAPEPGGLGGTYAGSPIGCAAALAVLDIIEDERLVDAANHIAKIFSDRLHALKSEFPNHIGDIRCDHGAMIALELVEDGNPSRPDIALTKAIATKAYQQGLIALTCGVRGNVFRFLPALTISDALVEDGLDIFERCLRGALSGEG